MKQINTCTKCKAIFTAITARRICIKCTRTDGESPNYWRPSDGAPQREGKHV